jgi:hypothetical protein
MQTDEEIHEKIRQSHRDEAKPRRFFSKAANPCFRTFLASSYFFFILEILALKMNGAVAVPDPEPRLLGAKTVEPAKLQLLFRPSRKYAASTHFIHVRVPFNFSLLLETPAQIFENYQTYINKWPEPFRMQVQEVADISRSCLADKVSDFNNILAALPEYELVTREKRFLDLVSFGMSATALTLATYNTARISKLETQIATNNKRLDHLVDITALHKKHFKAVVQAQMTDFMEQKFGTAVAISERLIRTVYSNRLSPGALHHDALVEIVKYVNEVAANSDMLSFVHKPSDLFLVETSYVYKPDEKTFVLVLHVPLVTPHNLMPLYEFIPLPIYFNFSSNITVMPDVGPNNMIAVGHSESYQLLSSSDLQNCNKMGETFFCKGRNVLLTDLTKTCLGSLYLTDHTNIQTKGKFTVDGAQEKIFRLDSHTYVVYSLGKISTNQVCPKGKSITAVQISSGQTIRINPSCYIWTMDHIITADDSEEVEILDKWLEWTWTLPQLFQQPEERSGPISD